MFSTKICLFLFFTLMAQTFTTQMDILHEWKYVDYLWKSEAQKQSAINSGYRNKSIIIDVDEAPDGRTFVTVVGLQHIPASLNTISNRRSDAGPLLRPYPDWSWYENNKKCNGITSVFRVAIQCNHLWVLDNGKFGEDHVCPPQLLVFNLANDKLVRRDIIPNHLATNASGEGLLITPIVQAVGTNCQSFQVNVFMADVESGAMVVLNTEHNTMWRLEGKAFEAEMKFANHTIAGESFPLPDALFGMALSPYGRGQQYLAFTSLSSRSLHLAYTSDIINSYSTKSLPYRRFENIFSSEVTQMAFSTKGVLFFGLTTDIAIGCWNDHKKLIPENLDIASQNYKTLQFTSGMKIVPQLRGQEKLLIVTNRYQKFQLETMNFNEINYRILQKSVKSLIYNTKCKIKW